MLRRLRSGADELVRRLRVPNSLDPSFYCARRRIKILGYPTHHRSSPPEKREPGKLLQYFKPNPEGLQFKSVGK